MTATARQFVLPSLCPCALTLGTRWIYGPAKITRLHPGGPQNYDDRRSADHAARIIATWAGRCATEHGTGIS